MTRITVACLDMAGTTVADDGGVIAAGNFSVMAAVLRRADVAMYSAKREPGGRLPVQVPRPPGGQPGTYLQPRLGVAHEPRQRERPALAGKAGAQTHQHHHHQRHTDGGQPRAREGG